MSQGSDLAGSYIRSSDGLGADGELTPSTKKTALEAMRKVLSRCEYTPRTPRDFDEDMEMDAEERDGEVSHLNFHEFSLIQSLSIDGSFPAVTRTIDLNVQTGYQFAI